MAALLLAGPTAAVPIVLDFSGYVNGTRVDQIAIPGVTFIASDPSKVFVAKKTLQINVGVDGNDLVIRLDSPASHGVIELFGFGNCQTGTDTIEWANRNVVVERIDTFIAVNGRCDYNSFERALSFTELRFDVLTGEMLRIGSATFDTGTVAEPSVLALFGLGLAGIAASLRRRDGAGWRSSIRPYGDGVRAKRGAHDGVPDARVRLTDPTRALR